jgi:hypothetical protein
VQWDPNQLSCLVVDTTSKTDTLISIAIADMALLFIMLVGLLRLRHDGGGTFGLTHLLWKQVQLHLTPIVIISIH